jgi:hypothetical protein
VDLTENMASAGTLLSELDAKGPTSTQDNDLVERILMDMNSSGGNGNSVQTAPRGMAAPPPPLPANLPPGVQPGTSFPQASDPMTAQAHVIGRDHPTPGDFAAAMYGMNNRPAETQMYAGKQGQGQGDMGDDEYEEPKKNWYARILQEMKTPLVVALLFFVLSLPAVNLLVAHYVPSLILPTGSLTMVGLGAKALLAGATFWILVRVITPLLKA